MGEFGCFRMFDVTLAQSSPLWTVGNIKSLHSLDSATAGGFQVRKVNQVTSRK